MDIKNIQDCFEKCLDRIENITRDFNTTLKKIMLFSIICLVILNFAFCYIIYNIFDTIYDYEGYPENNVVNNIKSEAISENKIDISVKDDVQSAR